jgi:hypothetical protein
MREFEFSTMSDQDNTPNNTKLHNQNNQNNQNKKLKQNSSKLFPNIPFLSLVEKFSDKKSPKNPSLPFASINMNHDGCPGTLDINNPLYHWGAYLVSQTKTTKARITAAPTSAELFQFVTENETKIDEAKYDAKKVVNIISEKLSDDGSNGSNCNNCNNGNNIDQNGRNINPGINLDLETGQKSQGDFNNENNQNNQNNQRNRNNRNPRNNLDNNAQNRTQNNQTPQSPKLELPTSPQTQTPSSIRTISQQTTLAYLQRRFPDYTSAQITALALQPKPTRFSLAKWTNMTWPRYELFKDPVTRSNWERVPLYNEQLHYAALDALIANCLLRENYQNIILRDRIITPHQARLILIDNMSKSSK